ncbi:MAG: HAMP domain-containing histidine kinase [Bacteroidales bacterium]|nr:HAMP domain-containing histidine kinase [Bacteroidales bacterium]
MKEKFLKIQFLVYAVLFFAAVLLLEAKSGNSGSMQADQERVQKVLLEKEAAIDNILAQMRSDVESGEGFVKDGSVWMYDRNIDHITDNGFSVFIYEDDTLRYWTDNSIALDRLYSHSGINNTMKDLNNGWYEIRTVKARNVIYLGLILIKKQYRYNNQYLRKHFQRDFQLDTSYNVSMTPIMYGMDFKDNNNDYIFSLVPINTVDTHHAMSNKEGVLFLLALVMLLMFVRTIVVELTKSPGNSVKIITIIALVVVSRVVLWMMELPTIVYSIDFFDPAYFADESLFSTVGDFIANMVVWVFLLQYIWLLADYNGVKEWIASRSNVGKYIVWGALVVVFFVMYGYMYIVTRRLVCNSHITFQLTNVMALDFFSCSGFLIVLLLTASVIYSAILIARCFDSSFVVNFRRSVIVYLGGAVALSLITWLLIDLLAGFGVLYAFLLIGAAIYMQCRPNITPAYNYIFMLLLSAIFFCAFITITTEQKADRHCAGLVSNPSDYSDPVAELLLEGVSSKIQNDAVVPEHLIRQDTLARYEKLNDYLQHQYFSGYWTRYYLNLTVLESANGNFSDISDPFVKAVTTRGVPVNRTAFYLVTNPDGAISYYAPFKFRSGDMWYFVCIALDRKPIPQELGYPSLLIDSRVKASAVDGMDYVRYHNEQIISQNGDYNYDLTDRVFVEGFSGTDDTLRTMRMDGYVHTVYHKDNNTVVVSRKQVTFIDFVIQLAYLYMIYMVVLIIHLGVKMLMDRDNNYRYKIKSRLIFSITLIMLVSFFSICGVTVRNNIVKFHAQNEQEMEEKVSSVYVQLEQMYGDSLSFPIRWSPSVVSKMDEVMTKMSHVFFSDVNLYGVDGEMVACSRPEIFKAGLMGTRIDMSVLKRFVMDRKAAYSHEEQIGDMSFASAYIPFYNNNEKLIGYINLPYFTKPEELERELSTIVVSIINLYVVLMMISIVLGVIISDRIVQPIKLIQSKIETIELGKNYEKIDYDRKDELGQLVAEYNKMVDKLDESAKLLAKGERESAWREMAKQIAHEIKNPLTPMKLSIQFLTRSWDAKNPDFEGVLNKVSSTLIQQIDTLSSIATGFSNFAKLPQPDAKPLNMVEVIDNVVQLFHTVENCDITSDMGGKSEVIVMADKEQMTRVFVNIIKNATQAIPEGVRGKIHVSLEVPGDKLIVRIADNGCGIPDEIREKLFTPNFTTKSSGSGLGLAMVKNMVINAKGDITFESEVGKGTTFIITLPVGA